VKGDEIALGKPVSNEEVEGFDAAFLVDVDLRGRRLTNDAQGPEGTIEVMSGVDASGRVRARVEQGHRQARELLSEQREVGPGEHPIEPPEERQQVGVVRRFLEEGAKPGPVDRVDAGRKAGSQGQPDSGLRSHELDLARRPHESPQGGERRESEDRVAEASGAEREDAPGWIRW
jgi:hypothetical protein